MPPELLKLTVGMAAAELGNPSGLEATEARVWARVEAVGVGIIWGAQKERTPRFLASKTDRNRREIRAGFVPEVEDSPDRWVPPVSERERERGPPGRCWADARAR